MIIQCNQCNTKFRLDDAKVPDKGVKVRCAKCKQVFMVHKETPAEETDLDFLLSGLGGPAAAAEKDEMQGAAAFSPAIEQEEWGGVEREPGGSQKDDFDVQSDGNGDQTARQEFGEDLFAAKEVSATQEGTGLGPGEFAFEEEGNPLQTTETDAPSLAAEAKEELQFGEFPFEEESSNEPGVPTEPVASGHDEGFDFGAMEFTPAEPAETKSSEDVGEVKAPPLAETENDFDFSSYAVLPEEVKESKEPHSLGGEEKREEESQVQDFGAVGFAASGPAVMPEEEMPVASEPFATAEPVSETATGSEPVAEAAPPLSFSSGMPSADEELPPLAISTRKKGRSVFSVAVTAIAVVIVLAIGVVGFYVFQTGPAAFNKLGLSFIAKWAGMETGEEGGIAIRNPQGAFMTNREAGEIFVVSGEAVNNFKKPRASIQVKANVLGKKGEVLIQKSAYCGNVLSKEQLATLPMAKIEESMASPFGDSLANLGVQPGKAIPFVIVFSGVPQNAGEFSVEVVGSTHATQ